MLIRFTNSKLGLIFYFIRNQTKDGNNYREKLNHNFRQLLFESMADTGLHIVEYSRPDRCMP